MDGIKISELFSWNAIYGEGVFLTYRKKYEKLPEMVEGKANRKRRLSAFRPKGISLKETGSEELIEYKLHDFGFSGVSCPEQAGLGGSSHLVNFKGTDTMPGVLLAKRFYDEPMAGFSIPASEHSTITTWGEGHETEAMANMLRQYSTGLMACVSDSYDIYNACDKIWGEIMEVLGHKFGSERNNKGFYVLNPKVRIIQGDGVDVDSLARILERLAQYKWSADNISFGSGGGLLQKLNRDTQRFAFKCSDATVGGEHMLRPVSNLRIVGKRGGFLKKKGRNDY